MIKPQLQTRHDETPYKSYVIGFILSVVTTLVAYLFVVNNVWPKDMLVYIVMGLAVVQLAIQSVFFLHIGRGSRWKFITFMFAILVVLIVVVGSLWIMHHLDYNMMHMTPDQMQLYMKQNEGI